MSMLGNRLETLEERQAVRDYMEHQREFRGRSHGELEFFAVHGYFPENSGGQFPRRLEFEVKGIRTIVTSEWAAKR